MLYLLLCLCVGCLFLTYETMESTQRAIEYFNNNVRLPSSSNPVQMRPADAQGTQDGTCAGDLMLMLMLMLKYEC